jgi:hypothetical protein
MTGRPSLQAIYAKSQGEVSFAACGGRQKKKEEFFPGTPRTPAGTLRSLHPRCAFILDFATAKYSRGTCNFYLPPILQQSVTGSSFR